MYYCIFMFKDFKLGSSGGWMPRFHVTVARDSTRLDSTRGWAR